MVLVPQETLNRLQAARRLEQTPVTRIVHGLDADMKFLLDRQDLTTEEKLKRYNQVLGRYMELNRQRKSPMALTLHVKDSNLPSTLKTQVDQLKKESPPPIEGPPKLESDLGNSQDGPAKKVRAKQVSAAASLDVPPVFAEASHLPVSSPEDSQAARRTRRRNTQRKASSSSRKWTAY